MPPSFPSSIARSLFLFCGALGVVLLVQLQVASAVRAHSHSHAAPAAGLAPLANRGNASYCDTACPTLCNHMYAQCSQACITNSTCTGWECQLQCAGECQKAGDDCSLDCAYWGPMGGYCCPDGSMHNSSTTVAAHASARVSRSLRSSSVVAVQECPLPSCSSCSCSELHSVLDSFEQELGTPTQANYSVASKQLQRVIASAFDFFTLYVAGYQWSGNYSYPLSLDRACANFYLNMSAPALQFPKAPLPAALAPITELEAYCVTSGQGATLVDCNSVCDGNRSPSCNN